MLRDPDCNIRFLSLTGNAIDDMGAFFLADALKSNTALEYIPGGREEAIGLSGWDVIAQALCNTSSINQTYSSNHKLRMVTHIRVGHGPLPTNI